METLYVLFTPARRLAFLLLATLFFISATIQAQTYTGFAITEGPPAPPGNSPNPNDPTANVVDAPVELGVKFKVSVSGVINGIRFYKGVSNTGTHIGNLWTNGNSVMPGVNLATATFTGETASGWQEVTFATPVAVIANTVYVASYYVAGGTYGASDAYFNNGDDVRGPITFIDVTNDPLGAGNGVFAYGGSSTFPTTSFNASNYWVDVRFTPTFPLPVSLVSFSAAAGHSDVSLSWKTESEDNNKGFAIQRSNNNRDWYDISFVNGAGQSSITRNYTYSDKGLAPGIYYYRLNQFDFDGKSKASFTVTATIAGRGAIALFQNAPNPVGIGGSTRIRFDLSSAQRVRLSVFDLNGREIKVLVDNKRETGTHLVTLDATGLSRQLYYIRLQTENGIFTKKLLIQ